MHLFSWHSTSTVPFDHLKRSSYFLDSRNLVKMWKEEWREDCWLRVSSLDVACDICVLHNVTNVETQQSLLQLSQILLGSHSDYCCYFCRVINNKHPFFCAKGWAAAKGFIGSGNISQCAARKCPLMGLRPAEAMTALPTEADFLPCPLNWYEGAGGTLRSLSIGSEHTCP